MRLRYDDFDAVMATAQLLRLNDAMQTVITQSPLGHDVAYYLATHQQIAKRIYRMDEVMSFGAMLDVQSEVARQLHERGQTSVPTQLPKTDGH